MPIRLICPGCEKTLKAPETMAGKQSRCPHCKTPVQVPAAEAQAQTTYMPSEPSVGRATVSEAQSSKDEFAIAPAEIIKRPAMEAVVARSAAKAPALATAPVPARTAAARETSSNRSKSAMLYWLFALTLVPLVFSLLGNQEEFSDRLAKTFEAHPEALARLQGEQLTKDDLFAALPNAKLEDAHLSRHSWMHWLYALASAVLFYGLILSLFEHDKDNSLQMLTVAAITATVGVFSLLAFQFIADWTQGYWVRGRSIIVLLFYVVKFVGFSYRAALDPSNGFLASFFGFTFGVGLCEELTKALPIFIKIRDGKRISWRTACALGLASGAGFGIAEGIMYASDHYNGISTWGIYPVRFISCVALHAIWTAAVALMVWHNQEIVSGDLDWGDWILALLKVQGIPMVLHGLYDTLLKREMNAWAVVAAVASFAWLAFLVSRSRASDPEPAPCVQHATAAAA